MNPSARTDRMVGRRARSLRALAVIAGVALMLPAVAFADTVFPLAKPGEKVWTSANFADAATLSDGSTIVVGNFQAVNGVGFRYLAHRLTDGSIDPAFAPNPDFPVGSVVVDGDDAIYVAGSFTSIGGAARAGIAKLSVTGAVDASFDPGVGAGGGISQMRLGAAGELFVAGSFSAIGGVNRNRIAKLSSSTGAVFADWAPQISGNFGVTIRDLAYDAGTSSLFVGGDFQRIDGVVRLYLLKLDANGTGAGDPAWDPTPNLPVNALQLDGAGGLYVGGAFDAIGGMQQGRLARLSTTTGAIQPWFPALPIGQSINDIALLGTALHVGGLVTEVNGVPRDNIARLSTVDASLDLGFDADFPMIVQRVFVAPDGTVMAGSAQQTHADGQVRTGAAVLAADGSLGPKMDLLGPGTIFAMSVLPGGETVLAGDFYYVDAFEHANLAKLSVDGDIVATWTPSTDGDIRSIATDALGNVYVAGGFRVAGGLSKPFLAKFSTAGTGSVDAAWSPLPDASVRSVSVASDGAVFVGGGFAQIGGLPRARIARLQPGDGAAVPGWGSDIPASTNGGVTLVSATPAGDVFASGPFTQINGVARTGLAKLSGADGVVDPGWIADLGGGVGMGAAALDIAYLGGDALLAGTFTTIGGIGRRRLARVSVAAPATVDPTWDPTTNGFEMTTLEVGHDDGVYVSGFVNQIDGQPRNKLAKLVGPGGSPDPAWVADTYWPALNAIVIQANGNVLIGGTWKGDLSSDYVSLVPRFGLAALPPAIPVVVLPDPMLADGFE